MCFKSYIAAIAQLAEHKTEDLRVAGSNPARGTFYLFNSFLKFQLYIQLTEDR